MPIELARALHARFNHSGKHRLTRVLELFGWLDIYTLPLKIPCAACAVAKTRRRPHNGKLIRATYPGEIWHVDIMEGGLIAVDGSDIGSKYAAIFTDEDIRDFIDYLCRIGRPTQIYYLWRPILKDPFDDHVLEVAVASESPYIVSYNKKDFKAAKSFGIEIVSPFEFLKTLGGNT